MEIYTSYFYKVRFFKPNMIPISTAKWDPKWYYNFKRQGTWWIDKNGVINGLRADVLAPGPVASELCRGLDNCITRDPQTCAFLKAYEAQLNELDFSDILQRTKTLCEKVKEVVHYQSDPIAVFLVYETPANTCSERGVIQHWFKKNGIIVKEWG